MYIDHLNRFFEISRRDHRLSSSHFSLYMALFQAWNRSRFKACFFINRQELMELSHLGSRSTYAKALTDLHAFGYIRIEKPGNRFGRSLVTIRKLNNSNKAPLPSLFDKPAPEEKMLEEVADEEQELDTLNEKFGPPLVQNKTAPLSKSRQVSGPIMGHIKDKDFKEVSKSEDMAPTQLTSFKNISEIQEKDILRPAQKCGPCAVITVQKNLFSSNCKKENSGAPSKAKLKTGPHLIPEPPTLKEVYEYFVHSVGKKNYGIPHLTSGQMENEALKFYAHYNAIGWCLGGSNPIKNWKAAGIKWICNSTNYPVTNQVKKITDTPHLPIPPNNNYDEPL